MVTVDRRQEIIATNKSLRLIKNELENLLEKGAISDHVFESISALLPAESSFSSTSTPNPLAAQQNASAPSVSPSPVPVNAMADLALRQNPSPNSAPPAYNTTGPPALPSRAKSAKPVIARARALFKYQAADDRDLAFQRDDQIAVHEYMNDDWWMGRNERTGAEGIFPKTYVHIDHNEKAGFYAPPQQPVYASPAYPANSAYPPPTQAQNPYNSQVPPMAVAEGSGPNGGGGNGSSGKMNEAGKKFGKKLGNAAIFGAGATIGSNLVNSIF
ncbi:SH3 domain-containing protein [Xylaria nigripes]|nr:SH3 domain-containing protein [Xylaria nigripes]